MGETAASNPASLQVSVSFGRFENDHSLSWEKWSAFSPNKYLEEVEKCATPGSVAQKKAYFEAHYKSIAARKAELLAAQEKQSEKDLFGLQSQNSEDLNGNACGDDAGFGVSNTQGSIEGVIDNHGNSSVIEVVGTNVDTLEDAVAVSKDCLSPLIEGENEDIGSRSDSSRKDKPEETANVVKQEDNPNTEAKDVKEILQSVDNETAKTSEIEAKGVKLDYPKVSKKVGQVTPVHKASNTAKSKQKLAPSTSKASPVSVSKSSRPTSTQTKTLASPSSTKRGSSRSLSGGKVTSTVENRKVSNKSLHMSLSLGPSKPDPAPNAEMRKSFIMENMGDKDIVKRAFKTFQNNPSQLKFGEDKSLVKKQVPLRGTEPRVPTSIALRKENREATRVDSTGNRSRNAVRSTFSLKGDVRAEKGKESPRKIDKKSNAKEVERSRLQSKSKEEKLKHNFKATSVPAFYRGQKVSKSHPEKGHVKNEELRV